MTEAQENTRNTVLDMLNEIESAAKKDPDTSSMIGGAVAVGASYVVMSAVPALAITGSIIYTLYSIGSGTQKKLHKRWSR